MLIQIKFTYKYLVFLLFVLLSEYSFAQKLPLPPIDDGCPVAYTVGGGGIYCSGSGKNVTLSDSEQGVTYQLRRNGTDLGNVKNGTGSSLMWSGLATIGTYTVRATMGACSKIMNGEVDIVSSQLSVYTVGGGGGYCSGGSGKTITLSDSQSGVSYTLYNGGSALPSLTGTGGALSWPNQKLIGTYTIVATNGSGCSKTMSGSKSISIISLPSVYTVGG
ncbi:hypothetical protein SAMN04488028_1131, partial [Reichenbachiella agariperforans]